MLLKQSIDESKIPLKPFFSLNEFSNLIGRHRDSVKKYIDHGIVKAHKIGGNWAISRKELLKYII